MAYRGYSYEINDCGNFVMAGIEFETEQELTDYVDEMINEGYWKMDT